MLAYNSISVAVVASFICCFPCFWATPVLHREKTEILNTVTGLSEDGFAAKLKQESSLDVRKAIREVLDDLNDQSGGKNIANPSLYGFRVNEALFDKVQLHRPLAQSYYRIRHEDNKHRLICNQSIITSNEVPEIGVCSFSHESICFDPYIRLLCRPRSGKLPVDAGVTVETTLVNVKKTYVSVSTICTKKVALVPSFGTSKTDNLNGIDWICDVTSNTVRGMGCSLNGYYDFERHLCVSNVTYAKTFLQLKRKSLDSHLVDVSNLPTTTTTTVTSNDRPRINKLPPYVYKASGAGSFS